MQQSRCDECEQTGKAAQEHDHRDATQFGALLDEHWLDGQSDDARGQREHFDRSDFGRQRSVVDLLGLAGGADAGGFVIGLRAGQTSSNAKTLAGCGWGLM